MSRLRKIIREEVKNVLQEKNYFTGSSGTELKVDSRDYDPRTGTSGISISINDSPPALLNDEQARELIKSIKLNLNRD